MDPTRAPSLLDGDLLAPPRLGFANVRLRGGWTIRGEAGRGIGYAIADADGLYTALCRIAAESPWRLLGCEARLMLSQCGSADEAALAGLARLSGLDPEAFVTLLWSAAILPEAADRVVRRTWALRTGGGTAADTGADAATRRPPLVMRYTPDLGWEPEPPERTEGHPDEAL